MPERSAAEFADWFQGDERFRRFSQPKPDVSQSAMRSVTISACGFRPNPGPSAALGSAGLRVFPGFPGTARARRELRPKRYGARPVGRSCRAVLTSVALKRHASARALPRRAKTAHQAEPLQRRLSLFHRGPVLKPCAGFPRGSSPVSARVTSGEVRKRPQYIPRNVFLGKTEAVKLGHGEWRPTDCLSLRTIFSPPH